MIGNVQVGVPVSKESVESEDEVVLVHGEVAALDVGAQVIDPPQPTALPTPRQPCTHNR